MNVIHPTENWFVLDSGPGAPAENMAWDEAILEAAGALGGPVLRFYSWTEPAASFGYFQRIADVEAWTPLRPLVRRPTGGGLVPHDADWTYSLTFPPAHGWFQLRAAESYRRLHEWVRDAFARAGLPTELAARGAKELPGRCFAGPEKSDLLWRGAKIAGAAQRRTKHGLLIQGSIQPPPLGMARADWQRAMREVATEKFAVVWNDWKPLPTVVAAAAQLARSKYSQDAHNRRR